MAKNYTRHAKARRFERPNFGDMGLRAYQEQQKRIIDGMKLQAAQHKEVRDNYQSSSIDKARKERENRQELKEFEDAVWDNKQLSKKIRADREVEALEQKALEAEKSSKFWLDFSTTYSQQYAKVATDIHDAIDLKGATKKVGAAFKSGEYNDVIENTKILNNISQVGVAAEQEKNLKDKTKTGEQQRDENAKLRTLQQVRSHNKDRILSERLINDIDRIVIHLNDAYEENNLKLDKDNIESAMQDRALEIMAEFGINPNSDGGQKFLKAMWKRANDEGKDALEKHKAVEDQYAWTGGEDAYNEGVGILPSLKATTGKNEGIEWQVHFSEGLSHHMRRYVTDPETGITTLIKLNEPQAYQVLIQELVEEGVITSDNYERLTNIPYPGQKIPPEVIAGKAKDTRKLWWDRHPGMKDITEKAIKEKEDQQIKDDADLKKRRDHKALTQLKVDVEDGKYDLNNLDDISKLREANAKNEKTLKFVNEAAVFNPTNNETDGYLVTEKLNKQYQDNEYDAYVNAMQYLGEDDKKRFNKMTRQLDALNANGATASDVRKRMERHIKDDLGINDINTRTHATAGPMAEIMIDDFYYQYRIVANDKKYTSDAARVEAAYEKVLERYDSKRGVYTRKKDDSGTKTIFTAVVGVSEPNTSLESKPTEEIDAKIALGWDNLFEEAKPEKGDFEVLDKDYLDRNLRNALLGKSIEPNSMIDTLYITQPQGAKMLSKTEIFNKYLESKGISTRVPAGPLDHAEFTALNTQININNFNKLSDENKMRMKTYLETGVMPTAKPKDVQNLEKNNGIRQNFSLESQYSKREVKDMNKSNKPWWWVPEDLGRKLIGDHYYDKNK